MLTPTNPQPLVLIADDDPASRQMLRRGLESQHYEVAEASDGPDALQQVALLCPALVLLDVMMPGLDGFEVCARLRAAHQHVPIIMMTALDEQESIDQAYEAGADDYVMKPIDWRILMHRVAVLAQAAQARRLLEDERNLLRMLIDNLPDEIYVKDAQSRFLNANIAVAQVHHLSSPDDLIGKSDFDLQPYEDALADYQAEQVIMQSGEGIINRETANRERTRWRLETKLPLRDSGGRIVGLVGVNRIITDRKQAQMALENERHLLRTLIDNLPDYIFIKDAQGRFVVSNLAHARAAQARSADELIGKTAFDFWAQDLAAQYQADDQTVIDKGEPLINAERTTVDAAGEERVVLTTKIPLRSADGKGTWLIGISRDITQRKRAEEALAVTTTQLNNLFDSLEEVFFSLDEVNHRTLQVSPACEKVFGVSRQAFFEQPELWRRLTHPESQALIPAMHTRLADGETIHGEYRIVRPDGEIRWIEMKIKPLLDEARVLIRIDGIASDVTRRHEAEEALIEREASFRHLFVNNPLPMWVYDLETLAFLGVNEAAIDHYGYSREDFLSMGIADIRPLEDVPRFLAHLAEERPAQQRSGEWRHRLKDGHIIDVEITSHTLEFNGRKAVLVVAQDITERKRAEALEREQRAQAEALHDIAKAITGTLDVQLVMEHILNHAGLVLPHDTANILLIEGDAIKNVYWHGTQEGQEPALGSLVLPTNQIPPLKEMQATGEPYLLGDTHTDQHWSAPEVASYIGAPIKVQGEVVGFFNLSSRTPGLFTGTALSRLQALSDLAAIALQNAQLFEALRLHAETLEERVSQRTAELQHERDLLQALMDNVPDFIYYKDTASAFTRINRASVQGMGIADVHAAVGKTDFDFLLPHPAQQFYADEQRLFRTGEPILDHIEFNPLPDGTERWLSTNKVPIRDKEGAIVGLVGVSRDITEYKRMERNLREALAQQTELSALKTRFITMASHEFRTPLTVISSSASLLSLNGENMLSEHREKHFTKIQTSVKQIVELLDEVLLIGQAESGSLEFNPEHIDLEGFCRDIVEEMDAARICLEVTGTGLSMLADKKLLRQILTNLLSNALKYSPESSPVCMTLVFQDGRATIEVKDLGIGISQDDQSRLFEPFYRARNVGKVKGTGLGLAITKKAVELHGGTIQLESKEGSGTTFIVSLPLSA